MSQNDREATVNLEHELDSTFSNSSMAEIRDGVAYPIRKTCRKPSEARIQDAPAVSSAANTNHRPAQIVETISNSAGKKITKRMNVGRFTKREIGLLFFITIAVIGCIVCAVKFSSKNDGEGANQPKQPQVSPPSTNLEEYKKLQEDLRSTKNKMAALEAKLNTLNATMLDVDIKIEQKLKNHTVELEKLIKSSKNSYTDQKFKTLQTTVVALENKLTAVNKTIQDNQDLTEEVDGLKEKLKDTQNKLTELETAIDTETCEQLNDQLNEVKNKLMIQKGLLKFIEEKVKDEPNPALPTTPTCKSDRKECNRRTVCFASVPIKQILDNTESCSNTNPNSKRKRRSCVSKQRRDSNCVEKAKKTYNCGNSVESTTESSISWVQFQKDFKRMIKEKKEEQTEIEAKREKNGCVKKPSPQPCVKTICPKKTSIKNIEPRRITLPSGCKKQSTTAPKIIAPRQIACKKSCEPKCKCRNRIAPVITTPASPATPSCSCSKKPAPIIQPKSTVRPPCSCGEKTTTTLPASSTEVITSPVTTPKSTALPVTTPKSTALPVTTTEPKPLPVPEKSITTVKTPDDVTTPKSTVDYGTEAELENPRFSDNESYSELIASMATDGDESTYACSKDKTTENFKVDLKEPRKITKIIIHQANNWGCATEPMKINVGDKEKPCTREDIESEDTVPDDDDYDDDVTGTTGSDEGKGLIWRCVDETKIKTITVMNSDKDSYMCIAEIKAYYD